MNYFVFSLSNLTVGYFPPQKAEKYPTVAGYCVSAVGEAALGISAQARGSGFFSRGIDGRAADCV